MNALNIDSSEKESSHKFATPEVVGDGKNSGMKESEESPEEPKPIIESSNLDDSRMSG